MVVADFVCGLGGFWSQSWGLCSWSSGHKLVMLCMGSQQSQWGLITHNHSRGHRHHHEDCACHPPSTQARSSAAENHWAESEPTEPPKTATASNSKGEPKQYQSTCRKVVCDRWPDALADRHQRSTTRTRTQQQIQQPKLTADLLLNLAGPISRAPYNHNRRPLVWLFIFPRQRNSTADSPKKLCTDFQQNEVPIRIRLCF
jgi:hypothetical protein